MQDADQRLLGLQRLEKPITTNSSGAATVVFPACRGRLYAIEVEDVDLDASADWTATGSKSGQFFALSNSKEFLKRPRTLVQGANGADIAGSMEAILLLDEDVTVVVAEGGNAKSGIVRLYLMRGLT